MSAALRLKARMTKTLQLNPYIERIFENHPPEEPLLPPEPLQEEHEEPDVRTIVVSAKPESMRPLPVLPTLAMRQILKLKLQTCFVGVLKQLDVLRMTEPDAVPHHDETQLLGQLLEISLRTKNTGVTAYALLQQDRGSETTLSPSEQLVSDRDLLIDEKLFDFAFWSLYRDSRNSEDPGGDPMARGRRWRDFMVRQRLNLFRLFNVQLLNIVETPLFREQNKQLTQLLFNTVWCVVGIDNCRLFRDPSVWQETLNRMVRCGRILEDRPVALLRVLQNLGAISSTDDSTVALLHDAANFVAGVMIERYFAASFPAKSSNLLYASLNDYDQTYVDHARQSMCASGDQDLGCFRFVSWERAREVILAWGTYFHKTQMQSAFLVGNLLNRRELARLAKYVEMRLYAFLYFVGKIRTLLMKQVQFRMGEQVVSIDNSQNTLNSTLVGEMFRFAALATAGMDSAWGVQALEMLPLIAIDFDDDVSEHELEELAQFQSKIKKEEQPQEQQPQQEQQPEQELEQPAEMNPEDFAAMFGEGLEEEQHMAEAASQEELDELFGLSPKAPERPPDREKQETPTTPRSPLNQELFKQSPGESPDMQMVPVKRSSAFGEELRETLK